MYKPQISNGGRYCISNTNQQINSCRQMLITWCINLVLFCNVVKKQVTFLVYFLSFNLADLYLPKEQSTTIKNLWYKPFKEYSKTSFWWEKSSLHKIEMIEMFKKKSYSIWIPEIKTMMLGKFYNLKLSCFWMILTHKNIVKENICNRNRIQVKFHQIWLQITQ